MLKTILLVLLIVLALVGLYFVVAVILEIRRRRRINRIFVDKVVDQIMEHWDATSEPLSVREESSEQAIDEQFEDAARLVVSTQSCIRSDLQRTLALGYARAGRILDKLEEAGIEGMEPIVTDKKTFIAAFVNAEKPQYLVVEDKFPNGRPPLEKAGVYFCDRDTVNMCEKMKVTTCLNPLHTAMSMYGCLLGYTLICEEMKDADIVKLVKRLGYVEGLPVVVDPKILSPKAFIDEVVNERLPNPFMPDDPRRIATDTSQKVGIRFGETIKSYIREGRDLGSLVSIPLAIAGWLRYLNGTFDDGTPLEVSPDPLKDELMAKVKEGKIREILSNPTIFGLDLTTTPLAAKIEGYYASLLEGPGSARRLLQEELA